MNEDIAFDGLKIPVLTPNSKQSELKNKNMFSDQNYANRNYNYVDSNTEHYSYSSHLSYPQLNKVNSYVTSKTQSSGNSISLNVSNSGIKQSNTNNINSVDALHTSHTISYPSDSTTKHIFSLQQSQLKRKTQNIGSYQSKSKRINMSYPKSDSYPHSEFSSFNDEHNYEPNLEETPFIPTGSCNNHGNSQSNKHSTSYKTYRSHHSHHKYNIKKQLHTMSEQSYSNSNNTMSTSSDEDVLYLIHPKQTKTNSIPTIIRKHPISSNHYMNYRHPQTQDHSKDCYKTNYDHQENYTSNSQQITPIHRHISLSTSLSPTPSMFTVQKHILKEDKYTIPLSPSPPFPSSIQTPFLLPSLSLHSPSPSPSMVSPSPTLSFSPSFHNPSDDSHILCHSDSPEPPAIMFTSSTQPILEPYYIKTQSNTIIKSNSNELNPQNGTINPTIGLFHQNSVSHSTLPLRSFFSTNMDGNTESMNNQNSYYIATESQSHPQRISGDHDLLQNEDPLNNFVPTPTNTVTTLTTSTNYNTVYTNDAYMNTNIPSNEYTTMNNYQTQCVSNSPSGIHTIQTYNTMIPTTYQPIFPDIYPSKTNNLVNPSSVTTTTITGCSTPLVNLAYFPTNDTPEERPTVLSILSTNQQNQSMLMSH